ncbi:unnamed protein product, partial [Pylaiella littoralis]
RNAFVPRAGAKVSLTQGDGSCAYHAVGGALTNAVGKSRAKTVLDLKRRTIAGAIQHTMQGTTATAAAAAAAAAATTQQLNESCLSDDQLARARALHLTTWTEWADHMEIFHEERS